MSNEVPYTTVRFYGTDEEINAQWVEARKSGIGGSDVASIMGLNKYSSPLEVWMEKTGRAETPDISDKPPVYWGVILEDVVADEFKRRHTDLQVKKKNAMLISRSRPWAFANLDRWVLDSNGNHGVLEIKTADKMMTSDWQDGVPAYYLTQVTHYLSITGLQYAWVAVLIGGNDYREFKIERDEEDIQAVDNAVDRFWNDYVVPGVPPALVGSKTEADAILASHSDPSDEYVSMLDADVPYLDEYVQLKEQEKAIKERKQFLENLLKESIGDHKGLQTETRRVTWSRGFTQMFDKKRFLEEHPEITEAFEACTSPKPRNNGLLISARKDS